MNEESFRRKYEIKGKYNNLLNEKIKNLRQKRPKVPSDLEYTLFEAGEFAQIWLQTEGCMYSKTGSCSCCDYWEGQSIINIAQVFKKAMEELSPNISSLLIETSGSVLDENEISMQDLEQILNYAKERKFKKVIIETHLNTINEDKLNRIKTIMSDTTICIEVGIESLSKEVLQYSLNKASVVGDEKIKQSIDLVHKMGFEFIANVMVGVPFLSLKHQIEDAVNSIYKLFESGVDFVILFPINIKEYTLVHWLYKNNMFKAVYGQMIIEIINQLEKEFLSKIDVVWYGNRKQENPSYQQDLIGPQYCDECQDAMMDFFEKFNQENSNESRAVLLENITRIECDCKSEMKKLLNKECDSENDFYEILDSYYEKIKKIVG